MMLIIFMEKVNKQSKIKKFIKYKNVTIFLIINIYKKKRPNKYKN